MQNRLLRRSNNGSNCVAVVRPSSEPGPQRLGFYHREGYLYLSRLIDEQTAEAARNETLELLRIVKDLSPEASRGRAG